jgi:hypothetical protein
MNSNNDEQQHAPRITAAFTITAVSLNLDACTAALGMQPDEVWVQQYNVSARDGPHVEWSVCSGKTRSYRISDAVELVLDRVWPKREVILRFAHTNACRLVFTCGVSIDRNRRPVYKLPQLTMRRLADLECSFSLDIIDYSSESV